MKYFMKLRKCVWLFTLLVVASSNTVLADCQENHEPIGIPVQTIVVELVSEMAMIEEIIDESASIFDDRIKQAVDSEEAGMKLFDEMLLATRTVYQHTDSESVLWQQMNALLADWKKEYEKILSRPCIPEGFNDMRNRNKWDRRIQEAELLQMEIFKLHAESASLLDEFESRREFLPAYYELGRLDEVQEIMQNMRSDLIELNEIPHTIFSQTTCIRRHQPTH